MKAYGIATYGDEIAVVYDDLYEKFQDIKPVVDTLTGLAKGGRVLELGIGTGRIALPLAKRGLKVSGIDSSRKMVAKMSAKVDGSKIPVTLGDFAEVPIEGKFSLVFVMFNTIFCLLTQESQVRCFQNVAKHLIPKGVFAIEAFVPDMTRFVNNQTTQTSYIDSSEVRLAVDRHDRATQRVTSQHIHITNGKIKQYPIELRYVWPSEMDLMAEIAGLRLINRWSDWNKTQFTSASGKHVSVYQKG